VLNALTVDVEDYFHVAAFQDVIRPNDWDSFPLRVETNTLRLLELFASQGVTATFFVLGWVARKCPALVKEICRGGHEVGCHGYMHQAIYHGSRENFRKDIRQAKAVIEDLVGRPVRSYRAPSYSITGKTLWALDVVREEGFEYDSSIYPIIHDLYGIPDAPRFPHVRILKSGAMINEFPPSTVRFRRVNFPVAGGGYFRLMPEPLTFWAIDRINRVEKQPAMVYLHPWEIDPDQPRIHASLRSRFRHYQGLRSVEPKLKNLLRRFAFGTLQQAFDARLPGRGQFHPLEFGAELSSAVVSLDVDR
jgi:polysaccharide deacetylase family protein (PEP-CTERM system associated)